MKTIKTFFVTALAILTLCASIACSAQTSKPVRKPTTKTTTTLPRTFVGLPKGCGEDFYDDWVDGQFSVDSAYHYSLEDGKTSVELLGFPKWQVGLTIKTYTNGIPFLGKYTSEDCYGELPGFGTNIHFEVDDPECEFYQDAKCETIKDYTVYLGETYCEQTAEFDEPSHALVLVKTDNSFVGILVVGEDGAYDLYTYTINAYICPSGISDSRYLQGKPKTTLFPKKSIVKATAELINFMDSELH